ncbi:uncharacterized protein SCHCODRAFT_02632043 [Schizophyllum commune H4-8]|nr:uncharacterized protein SCHCODRAFT_02632043 [Schizophyllum commune H4-8]KAI5890506.1 hypothetical protein SCHCODRAFT_02632043 [Schizophyllum commune H4-8]
MSSDDEFGFSDFPKLSASQFAAIDATAEDYYSQLRDAATQRTTPDPASAQKPGPSKPTLGKRKNTGVDDMDLLPDITIIDGGYALGAPEVKRPRHSPQQAQARKAALDEEARRKREADIEEALRQRDRRLHQKPAPRQKTPAPPRPLPQRQPSKPTVFRAPTVPPSSQNGTRSRGSSPMLVHHPPAPPQPPPQPPSRATTPASISADVQDELEKLRAELAIVKQKNAQAEAILLEEKSKRWGKDGEIAHLKDTLSKTTANYIAQTNKLREAKEAAEKQQTQLQRSMKDEIERIKTQFLFKQQELESRRPPMSVKAKKTARSTDFVAPVPMSSQMRGWSNAGAGTSRLEEDVFGGRSLTSQPPAFPSQSVRRSPSKTRSPAKPKPGALGFQNSFVASTPLAKRKGKQKENAEQEQRQGGAGSQLQGFQPASQQPRTQEDRGQQPAWDLGPAQAPSQPGFDWTVQSPPAIPSPPHSPTRMQVDALPPAPAPDGDVEMADGEEIVPEEFDAIEPIDWMGELTYLLLTHRLPSSTRTTLETIMRVDVEDDISLRICTTCNQILEIIGMHTKPADYLFVGKALAVRLVSLLQIFLELSTIAPLISLLNLMTYLIYSLPDFSSFLLLPGTDNTESLILESLVVILTQKLKGVSDEDKVPLEREVCELLSALAWNTPDDLMPRHRILTSNDEIMRYLINPEDSFAQLILKTQYLVRLSTHRTLASSLLPPYDPSLHVDGEGKPILKEGHVDRLCRIMVNEKRCDDPDFELRSLILTFLSMLSVGHAEALLALQSSAFIVPLLVDFTMQLANPIWEDDEELMSDPAKANSLIRLADQTVYLLWHIVKGREQELDLRRKLIHTSHVIVNGLMHVFVVAFGRLSYADPPDWVDKEGKDELQLLQGYTEELLNMVIDGPEGEAVWGTYQPDPENSEEAEEDEMEAEMLG